MSAQYQGQVLSKNTRAYELFQKKDMAVLDRHLKEIDQQQKQHLARYYKLPDERELYEQALQCYGLK